MIEGGGSKPYAGIRAYLLFAFTDIDNDKEVNEAIGQMVRHASQYNKHVGAEIVDLSEDDRLKNSLIKSKKGSELYKRILQNTPCLCISPSFVGDADHADRVRIFPMNQFSAKKLEIGFSIEEFINSDAERSELISFLSSVNSIVTIKPKAFGVGIDINKLFGDIVDFLEARIK